MRFIKFLVALVLFLSCGNNILYAQSPTRKITGKLVDGQNKAVDYATVTLMRPDSTIVSGDLTSETGGFNIETNATGDFMMRVTGISLETKYVTGIKLTEADAEKNLGNVKITSTVKQLKSVEVTGERAAMEMSIDKKVFNVDKNLNAAGGSATDVMQNIPSVSVDVDGNVSLRGKESIILIDGKPATMFGGDVASALQSLPAASIQSVEVITNPSAKYDAQGSAGIINIITKRDKHFGINGSVSAGIGTRNKYNGNLNLNLKNNKWNIFLNSSTKSNPTYQNTRNERTNTGSDAFFTSYDQGKKLFTGYFNTIGAEYTINNKNSITLTQNINRMLWGGDGVSNYKVYKSSTQIDSTQRRSSYSLGGPLSSSTSLDYKHKFAKEKQELTANVTFAHTDFKRTQEYETDVLNSDGSSRRHTIYQHAPGSGVNSSLNGQADYTMPVGKAAKFDAGLKTQMFWFLSENNPTVDSGSGTKVDSILLNNFKYSQQTHAAYTNYGGQHGNWGYQAGLRFEYAYYEGTINTLLKNTYTTQFYNLFPSAYISYKLPAEQNVYLSYTRRTNRPNFRNLMPFVDLTNPQDTNTGNPNLRPEFINNVELNYGKSFKKGHNITASVYYQYTEGMIERYRKFYADGTSFTQPQNLNTGLTYGLELISKLQLLKAWDATLSFNFFQNEVRGANIDPILNNSGFSWFSKFNTNIKLPAGFSLQMNGNYEAPRIAAQGTLKEVYWVDAAIKKNLLKNKATVTLNVSDIFNTRKYTTVYNYPTSTQTTYRDRETRIGNLTFTYRFGKSEFGKQDQPKSMGNGRKKDTKETKERENLKTDEGGNGEGGGNNSGGGQGGGQATPQPSGTSN
jgi:outer membrane receptor protein involved in Fe transport